jgi:hypothetical protein
MIRFVFFDLLTHDPCSQWSQCDEIAIIKESAEYWYVFVAYSYDEIVDWSWDDCAYVDCFVVYNKFLFSAYKRENLCLCVVIVAD